MGILVNSIKEWNIDYLHDLKEKFLQQEYPTQLIDEQFKKALAVDRLDLLFRSRENKKKKTIIAPHVITYNSGNPKFREWIMEEYCMRMKA